jgi:8-oxo-dGTP diphosphatase
MGNIRRGPSLVVDAVVEKDGSVLLIKRKNPPYKEKWALPGGFVEYGEKVEDALKREMLEEAGITIEITGLLGVYSDPSRDPRGHVVSVCYTATTTGDAKAGSDAADACFVSLEDIDMDNLAFDHSRIINDYIKLRKKG